MNKKRKVLKSAESFWCKHPDKNGNPIEMTKVKGSKVMSKKELQELNKIKLPF